jgi:protease I
MKKVAMIIAMKDYQDIEFSTPYTHFKNNGIIVDVYSTGKGTAHGAFGSTFNVQHELTELKIEEYDAITFVGGAGTLSVRNDKNSEDIVLKAFKHQKILGAICWSPTILAKAGILHGKKATVWNGPDREYGMLTSEYLKSKGAIYTGEDVTVDGNIITANGPPAAQKYAEALLNKLSD